jgi:hypothetical protein
MNAKPLLFCEIILVAAYFALVSVQPQTPKAFQPARPLTLQLQKTAPTIDQCIADAKAWYSKDADRAYDAGRTEFLNRGVPNPSEWSKISAHEVYVRMTEFQACMRSYPDISDEFRTYAYRYYGLLADRSIDYLTRHGELEQFMKEDAQGLR